MQINENQHSTNLTFANFPAVPPNYQPNIYVEVVARLVRFAHLGFVVPPGATSLLFLGLRTYAQHLPAPSGPAGTRCDLHRSVLGALIGLTWCIHVL